MRIFISWSGNKSKAVAELWKRWIKQVLQGTDPWTSTRDIEGGATWFTEISDSLNESGFGIVCLTQENKVAPWIHYEAGGLAKGLTKNRVATFLIDLTPGDVQNPLGQFHHTQADKESVQKLVATINKGLSGPNQLDDATLLSVFEKWWPDFEAEFTSIGKQNSAAQHGDPRTEASYLVEILENTRAISQRIGALEDRALSDAIAQTIFATTAASKTGKSLGDMFVDNDGKIVIKPIDQAVRDHLKRQMIIAELTKKKSDEPKKE